MVELFFALMLCILRETLKIGYDNVFIDTGNTFEYDPTTY